MMWFRNMNLGKKLIAAFSGIALMALLLSCWGIYNMNKMNDQYINLYENYGGATGCIGELGMVFNDMRNKTRDLLVATDETSKNNIVNELKEKDKRTQKTLKDLEAKITSEQGHKEFEAISKEIEHYNAMRDRVVKLSFENRNDEAYNLFYKEAAPVAANITKTIDNMFILAESGGEKVAGESKEIAYQTMLGMFMISVILVVLAIIIGVYISNSISRQIRALMEAANRVATGDLNVEVKAETKDEIGKLTKAFAQMVHNVNDAMHDINSASEQVAAGAKNVSDASISLSQGATEQASSVEQLSSSLEEIASQTKFNADNASKANEFTISAQQNAENGNRHMKEMLTAMGEINNSSANISRIIKVIDEIAFQTNILALNAAVEAARAGQHGKGFAVVAEEVRNLAARSAKAAKETTDMIEGSIEKVNDGTQIANRTAEALNIIVKEVTNVAELVDQIATASKEQNIALQQINQGVVQVSQVVQANSATSEESASSSEELSSQANLLKQTVNKFKLRSIGRNTVLDGKILMHEQEIKRYNVSPKMSNNVTQIALTDDEFGKY